MDERCTDDGRGIRSGGFGSERGSHPLKRVVGPDGHIGPVKAHHLETHAIQAFVTLAVQGPLGLSPMMRPIKLHHDLPSPMQSIDATDVATLVGLLDLPMEPEAAQKSVPDDFEFALGRHVIHPEQL